MIFDCHRLYTVWLYAKTFLSSLFQQRCPVPTDISSMLGAWKPHMAL